ncbi:inositol monophosphatase 1 [Anoplophora glabripennis]|nr:inositol monophosphatase 1 [Anoplophora glabripennis]
MSASLSILSRFLQSYKYRGTFNSSGKYRKSFFQCSSRMSSLKNKDLDLFYDTVMSLVKTAGELINEKISSRSKLIEVKSSEIDLVTETDQQVEKLLIDGLSNHFPEHKFIGEESVSGGSQSVLTDAPTWIIDPIDGTMNFVHSFPHSCVSIALFINQKPEIGIVYNPMLNQMFTARKGKGAFLNGKSIKVSGKTSLSDALIMMEFGTSRDPEKGRVVLENQKILMPQVHGLRALGSAALDMAMVACGAADVYFEYGIHIWDIAAGELLVTEAGGFIMDPAGGEIDRLSRRVLVASSRELAEKLSQTLVQFYPTPRD